MTVCCRCIHALSVILSGAPRATTGEVRVCGFLRVCGFAVRCAESGPVRSRCEKKTKNKNAAHSTTSDDGLAIKAGFVTSLFACYGPLCVADFTSARMSWCRGGGGRSWTMKLKPRVHLRYPLIGVLTTSALAEWMCVSKLHCIPTPADGVLVLCFIFIFYKHLLLSGSGSATVAVLECTVPCRTFFCAQ